MARRCGGDVACVTPLRRRCRSTAAPFHRSTVTSHLFVITTVTSCHVPPFRRSTVTSAHLFIEGHRLERQPLALLQQVRGEAREALERLGLARVGGRHLGKLLRDPGRRSTAWA